MIKGILLLLAMTALIWGIYKLYISNRIKTSLLIILLLGLILRLYVSNDDFLHEWDEKYHALVAKNIIKHPLKPTLYDSPLLNYDYKNWVANHLWLEKGPVPLWLIGASISSFGNNEIAVRLPSILLSILSIYITFWIGSALFNNKIGLLSAFLHSINGLLIEIAGGRVSSDHVELMFTCFVEIAMYLTIIHIKVKKSYVYPILIGLFTGLALLSKWTPALLVFPVWITGEILTRKKLTSQLIKALFFSSLSLSVVVLPWFFYILNSYPDESHWILKKFIFAYNEPVEQHTGPIYYYIQNIGIVFCEIIWIPIILSIYQILKKQTDWKMIFLSIWWIIPFFLFSLASTKRLTYLLIAAPAFFVIISYYWFYIKDEIIQKKSFRYFILFLLLALPIRYCIERVKPFQNSKMNQSWANELKQMKNQYDAKTVFFNYEHAIEGMFYTDYIFYSTIPSEQEIQQIKEQGYKVVIKD